MRVMRYLATVPEHIRRVVEGRLRTSGLSEAEVRLGEKLVTDERMKEAWSRLGKNYNATGGFCLNEEIWGDYYFWAAVQRFGMATNPSPWDTLTKREQEDWVDKFDALVAEMDAHLRFAPCPPKSLASLVVYDDISEAFPEIGEGKIGLARRLWNIEWSLTDALRHVAHTQRSLSSDNDFGLKRPRHEKSDRERYIYLLTGDLHCYYDQSMQELVAVTTEVAFEDPGVSVRLVRRITTGK